MSTNDISSLNNKDALKYEGSAVKDIGEPSEQKKSKDSELDINKIFDQEILGALNDSEDIVSVGNSSKNKKTSELEKLIQEKTQLQNSISLEEQEISNLINKAITNIFKLESFEQFSAVSLQDFAKPNNKTYEKNIQKETPKKDKKGQPKMTAKKTHTSETQKNSNANQRLPVNRPAIHTGSNQKSSTSNNYNDLGQINRSVTNNLAEISRQNQNKDYEDIERINKEKSIDAERETEGLKKIKADGYFQTEEDQIENLKNVEAAVPEKAVLTQELAKIESRLGDAKEAKATMKMRLTEISGRLDQIKNNSNTSKK